MQEFLSSSVFVVLLRMIAAHIVSDFVLQRNSWVEEKTSKIWKSKWLYTHSLIAAFLTYIFVWNWRAWWLLPLFFVSHAAIDGLKAGRGHGLLYFVLDQLCHLIIILLSWVWISGNDFSNVYRISLFLLTDRRFWVYFVSYALILWPAGILVDKITEPWRKSIEEVFSNGLKKAGMWIGCLERLLILTFMLMHYFEAIGFLIAAKSILRYGELNKTEEKKIKSADLQKKSEYILIGTMISFTVGITVGLLANWLLK